jgi:hypothetical protein
MICGAAGVDPAVSISANPASATQGVFLLRFFGHGNTGQMGVSSGKLYPAPTDHDGINAESIEGLRPILAPLSAIFGPYGSCELKGCNTGRGAGGQKMLAMLASIIGVPLTAALKEQEDERDTVSFYGPTKTAIPSLNGSKMTLKQWCHNLPDSPPVKETVSHHINPAPRGADPKDYGAGIQGRYRRAVIGVGRNAP